VGGTIGGESERSSASSINNAGQIVGAAEVLVNGLPRSHATLFSGPGLNNIDLGTLGGTFSDARAINDAGQIVGRALLPGDLVAHATLFSLTSDNIDLGTLGGTFSSASAINNSGQIVGDAQNPGDRSLAPQSLVAQGPGILTGDPFLTGVPSSASGINNAGQIVGFNENGERRATLFVSAEATSTSAQSAGIPVRLPRSTTPA
jgi:probable HAF family extracellular repeat protein